MPNKNDCPRKKLKVDDNCKDCRWYHKYTKLCKTNKIVMRCMKGMHWQIKKIK